MAYIDYETIEDAIHEIGLLNLNDISISFRLLSSENIRVLEDRATVLQAKVIKLSERLYMYASSLSDLIFLSDDKFEIRTQTNNVYGIINRPILRWDSWASVLFRCDAQSKLPKIKSLDLSNLKLTSVQNIVSLVKDATIGTVTIDFEDTVRAKAIVAMFNRCNIDKLVIKNFRLLEDIHRFQLFDNCTIGEVIVHEEAFGNYKKIYDLDFETECKTSNIPEKAIWNIRSELVRGAQGL